MLQFSNVTPTELAILSDAIAIALSKDNSSDINNVLGNLLVAVGSIILTVAAQQQNLLAIQQKMDEIKAAKNELKKLQGDI